MSGQALDEWQVFLDVHPDFKRRAIQFLALHDAAEILDDLKPPHSDTAADYLREIATHLVREAGIGEDVLQVMIESRPRLRDAWE